jgi:LPXTG-site transpeptidase (sortase) family protein
MNPNDQRDDPDNPAADLIRQRIENIYSEEPDAKEETAEAKAAARHRSKHQDLMYKLSISGKPLAEIQTAWHQYYTGLPDKEKHEVWQEFYSEHGKSFYNEPSKPHADTDAVVSAIAPDLPQRPRRKSETRTISEIKKQIVKRAGGKGQLKAKHHLQSLVFGLAMGALALFILLFSFFNERIIAPFITPSRHVSSTPIIADSTTAVSPDPEIIIPKINVEIPVDYNETSINDSAVEKSLEDGILHYPTTVNPGELGNAAFFGHSSNNIFNKGKYKFAFVLLKQLDNGDLFYITKNSVRYTYKVYDKRIVKPDNVSVLGATDKPATATLITCDPPGTSINRLVVWGEQISPDPTTNTKSTASTTAAATPTTLPSNAPSLWSRLVNWLGH